MSDCSTGGELRRIRRRQGSSPVRAWIYQVIVYFYKLHNLIYFIIIIFATAKEINLIPSSCAWNFMHRLHYMNKILPTTREHFNVCTQFTTSLILLTSSLITYLIKHTLEKGVLSNFITTAWEVNPCSCFLWTGRFAVVQGNQVITNRKIFADSHWIKLITWYKFGRWLLEDIHCSIWYLSSEEKPRNKQMSKLNF